jgi:hypothetical protein
MKWSASALLEKRAPMRQYPGQAVRADKLAARILGSLILGHFRPVLLFRLGYKTFQAT